MKIKLIKKIISFSFILYICMLPTGIAYQASMISNTYKIERDSINFEGGNSSSQSYTLEDTAGEVGSGDVQSSSYRNRAGYQQYSAAADSSDSSQASSVSSGSRPILSVNVINFSSVLIPNAIKLSWEYPISNDIQNVRIVRSKDFFPSDVNDGEIIFEGNTNSIVDYNIVPGVQYYYAIFAINSRGIFSSGVLTNIVFDPSKITDQDKETYDGEATDPFIDIPDAKDIPSEIQSITLDDFYFIQDGRKILSTNNIVAIDGEKELTIGIEYKKLPEVLKTIAVALIDPQDESKMFTFLLRVNKEKTAYEATIGALNKSGKYKISAIILDYKNQSLKRLNGSLKVSVFDIPDLFREKNYIYIVSAIILILLIIVIALLKIRRKEYVE